MSSQALVELALKTLTCSQKALAERLGVSPAQVSKWKKGEYMSDNMEKKCESFLELIRWILI